MQPRLAKAPIGATKDLPKLASILVVGQVAQGPFSDSQPILTKTIPEPQSTHHTSAHPFSDSRPMLDKSLNPSPDPTDLLT